MKDFLIVVDVQKDFVDGALGTPEAQQMLPILLEKVRRFNGTVILTQDTHTPGYLDTQVGKQLSIPHCIEGTPGWEFAGELETLRANCRYAVYRKPTFGSVRLAADLRSLYEQGGLASVELVGLCTDICVISNALLLKANIPELPIYVDASCCAGVTPEKHRAAMEVMKSCQIIVKEEV